MQSINQDAKGIMFLLCGSGWGSISANESHKHRIEVCEQTHPEDYKTVSEWINNIN